MTARCKADSNLNIVELKNKKLKPLIEEICNDAKCIYAEYQSREK